MTPGTDMADPEQAPQTSQIGASAPLGTARARRAGPRKARARRGERRTRRRAAAPLDSHTRPDSAVGPRLRSSECHFEKPTVLQTFPLSAMTCANTSSTTGLRTHSAREAFTVV